MKIIRRVSVLWKTFKRHYHTSGDFSSDLSRRLSLPEIFSTMFASVVLEIILFLIILYAAKYYLKSRRIVLMLKKFNGLSMLQFLKHLIVCIIPPMDYHRFQACYNMAEKFQDQTFYLWILHKPFVVVNFPKHIQRVSHVLEKGKFSEFMPDFMGNGLLTAKPEKWKRSRRRLNPVFKENAIYENFVPTFHEYNDELVERLKEESRVGGTNSMKIISQNVISCLYESMLGIKEGGTKDWLTLKQKMSRCGEYIVLRLFFPMLHRPLFFKIFLFICNSRYMYKDIRSFHSALIRNSMANKKMSRDINSNDSEEKQSAMSVLLNSDDLKEAELTNEAMNLLLAGRDTINTTTFFTLLQLAMNQDIQEKVYLEANEVFEGADSLATAADLTKLTFIEQCILESLRLYPPVPLYFRYAEKDISVDDDLIIPKGVTMMVSPFLTHRNPFYFPDPDKWNPANFEPEKVAGRPPYSFIPFGIGPRTCIGQKYAMVSMKLLISTLIRNFKLTTPQTEVHLKSGIVLKSVEGFNIQFNIRRKPNENETRICSS